MEARKKDLLGILSLSSHTYLFPNPSYNEVFKNIVISDGVTAKDKDVMKMLNITHILNCAQGTQKWSHVDTNQEYYKDTSITFMGLPCADVKNQNLSQHFESAADFIDEALNKNGRVVVHCVQGFSRAPSFVIAYLMLKKRMNLEEAVTVVRSKREVCPNDGFLLQLIALDEKLQVNRKS